MPTINRQEAARINPFISCTELCGFEDTMESVAFGLQMLKDLCKGDPEHQIEFTPGGTNGMFYMLSAMQGALEFEARRRSHEKD